MTFPRIPHPQVNFRGEPDNLVDVTFNMSSYICELIKKFDELDEAVLITWMEEQGYIVSHPDGRKERLMSKYAKETAND